MDGFGKAGLPGCKLDGDGWRRDGERKGEEKESRYNAMKKSSLRRQNVKRTSYKARFILASISKVCQLVQRLTLFE